MDFDCHGRDDTPSSPTAATDGPEQVLVLRLIGSDKAPVRCDNIDAKDLVGAKSVDRCYGRVAAAGQVATGNTNSLNMPRSAPMIDLRGEWK